MVKKSWLFYSANLRVSPFTCDKKKMGDRGSIGTLLCGPESGKLHCLGSPVPRVQTHFGKKKLHNLGGLSDESNIFLLAGSPREVWIFLVVRGSGVQSKALWILTGSSINYDGVDYAGSNVLLLLVVVVLSFQFEI